MRRYWCFWVEPFGMIRRVQAFDDLGPVLELVKQDQDEQGNVRGLSVVYGEKLEFEPCVVVQSYKIKNTACDS